MLLPQQKQLPLLLLTAAEGLGRSGRSQSSPHRIRGVLRRGRKGRTKVALGGTSSPPPPPEAPPTAANRRTRVGPSATCPHLPAARPCTARLACARVCMGKSRAAEQTLPRNCEGPAHAAGGARTRLGADTCGVCHVRATGTCGAGRPPLAAFMAAGLGAWRAVELCAIRACYFVAAIRRGARCEGLAALRLWAWVPGLEWTWLHSEACTASARALRERLPTHTGAILSHLASATCLVVAWIGPGSRHLFVQQV